MRDLQDLRKEIDEIDQQMVQLFERRMKICEEVGLYKVEAGKKVFDNTRENIKLNAVSALAETEFTKKGVRELYQQIMAMSRKLQYRLMTKKGVFGKLPFIQIENLDKEGARVVFQGVRGAYQETAVQAFFGKEVNSFWLPTFRDTMEALEEGSADYAVLPIENSSAGAVNDVYDLLAEFENYIVADEILAIHHCLAAPKGSCMDSIQQVFSHPQALSQCGRYLEKHTDWQQISVANTAIAAQHVVESQDHSKAAICSELAAELYGLDILEKEINDNKENFTRFIVVTNQKVFLKDAKKISMSFEVSHESGSLYQMLSHFIYNDLNMCKIESRPVPGRPWEYRFFVDIEGNMANPDVKNAIRGLREESRNLRILGNY